MKRRVVMALLSMAVVASLMAGCGDSVETGVDVQSEVSIEESAEVETEESESSDEVEDTLDSSEEEEVEVVESESAEESEAESISGSSEESEVEAEVETETSETSQEAEAEEKAYTFTELGKVMYAKSSVNVRNAPSTDGSKVDSLKAGQEVTVSAQCNETSWYQIGEGRYVSNKYLTETKPTTSQGTTSANNSNSGTTSVTGLTYEQALELCDVGDTIEIAEDGTVTLIKGSSSVTSASASTTTSDAASSREFVNYLNQQRVAAGLSELQWDTTLEANALKRAKEISSNFSHDGASYAEIIFMGSDFSRNGFSYVDWYNSWYNSDGHRANMFGNYSNAACAYYVVNENTYAVAVFSGSSESASTTPESPTSAEVPSTPTSENTPSVETPVPTTEDIQGQVDSGQLTEIDSYVDEETGSSVTVYGSDGVGVLSPDDPMYETVMGWDWGD